MVRVILGSIARNSHADVTVFRTFTPDWLVSEDTPTLKLLQDEKYRLIFGNCLHNLMG